MAFPQQQPRRAALRLIAAPAWRDAGFGYLSDSRGVMAKRTYVPTCDSQIRAKNGEDGDAPWTCGVVVVAVAGVDGDDTCKPTGNRGK